jgi:uncharacterized protein YukE
MARNHLQNALGQVNRALSDMTEEQNTLAANWAGETASKFGLALHQWLDDLGVVQSNLDTILNNIHTQFHIYVNTNDDSTGMVNAFQTGMAGSLSGLSGLLDEI